MKVSRKAIYLASAALLLLGGALGCGDSSNNCNLSNGICAPTFNCINQADCSDNQTCLNEGTCACFAGQNGANCSDSSDCGPNQTCSSDCQCTPSPTN